MKLGEWINSHRRHERAAIRRKLARYLDVSEVYVRSMANGNRLIKPEFASKIESFTKGAVTRYEQRPDVFGKAPPMMPAVEIARA